MWAESAPPPEPKPLVTERTFRNPDFQDSEPTIRVKDITQIQGIRENHLVGYGLVVGLSGTGDTLASSPQTQESLTSMLERLGVNVRDGTMSGKNVASVMVTATLPAFARSGSRIDVNVSAVGDAKNLQGGTLLVTPLLGANGEVISVAQGNISVSGFTAQGANASQTKGVPTAGKISNGGLIEKEVGYELADIKEIKMVLNTPDFTTSKRIADAINTYTAQKGWGSEVAKPLDMGTIQIKLPNKVIPFDFFHEIGHLEIQPDQKAKVLIDTQKDVIVVTSGVKMSPCAVASGSTIVKIIETPQVYMPHLPNGGILPTVSQTVGVNTIQLADFAKQANALKVQQREQTRILDVKQKSEIDKFEKDNHYPSIMTGIDPEQLKKITDERARQLDQLKRTQSQQTYQLNQNFEQELRNQQQQQQLSTTVGNQQQLNQLAPDSTKPDPSRAFEPVVTSTTKINVREEKGRFNLLSSGPTLDKFVNALNQLGVSVKDMGSILMTIKNAGALHAEIIMN